MEFAVKVVLDAPDKARWVLAVDPVGERLLLTDDDRVLHWVPMASCMFAKAASPDLARPVVALQPQQQGPQVVVPRPTIVRGNHG